MPTRSSVDAGTTIGMTVVFAGLDLEQALDELSAAGFGAAEVFVGHLGPRGVDAPVSEGHASVAGDLVRELSLGVSTLNCIVGDFDPFTSDEALEDTAIRLGWHLRLASAIGSPRVLIWDGEQDNPELLQVAPARLGRVIERARELARLDEPPDIAVELHPNTFALKHGMHEEVAETLMGVAAGVCLDFCHAAVALGADFATRLSDNFIQSVSHVHFADSDCRSEQLHFPPGAGRVDIAAAERVLEGRGLGVAWDLFGWPGPRHATTLGMARYREAVERIGRIQEAPEDADPR